MSIWSVCVCVSESDRVRATDCVCVKVILATRRPRGIKTHSLTLLTTPHTDTLTGRRYMRLYKCRWHGRVYKAFRRPACQRDQLLKSERLWSTWPISHVHHLHFKNIKSTAFTVKMSRNTALLCRRLWQFVVFPPAQKTSHRHWQQIQLSGCVGSTSASYVTHTVLFTDKANATKSNAQVNSTSLIMRAGNHRVTHYMILSIYLAHSSITTQSIVRYMIYYKKMIYHTSPYLP